MNTMKTLKTTVVLLLAILAMVFTSACGGSSTTTSSNQKVTVTVMTWESTQTNALIDSALKKFMQSNPNIIVHRIPSPNSDYGQKLSSMVIAKKLPDLFWAGNDTEQQYGSQHLLYDYSKYVNGATTSAFDASKFAPASIDNWRTPDGKLYGLPSLMNTYGIWYNADLFKAANLPLPKQGWTYDEMLHDAQVLTKKSGNTTHYGLVDSLFTSPTQGPFFMSNYAVSAGGTAFEDKINNPTTVTADAKLIEGTSKFATAVQAGYISPPGYDTSNTQASFIAGNVPMFSTGQWLAAGFLQSKPSFKYDFAPLPIVNSQVQPYDAVGICSPSYIQNPDAVWKVMQFLVSDAWETVLPGSPVAPTAYVPSASTYFDTLKGNGLSSTADAVNYALATPTKEGIRFTSSWSSKANDILTANWNNILLGKTPVDATMQKMTQQLNDLIKSQQTP